MAGFCKKYPREAYASLNRIAHASQWFELHKIAPGVTAIYKPHQWQEAISYLIEVESSALVFDTGNGIDHIAIEVSPQALCRRPPKGVNEQRIINL
jgi:hypothetical protein